MTRLPLAAAAAALLLGSAALPARAADPHEGWHGHGRHHHHGWHKHRHGHGHHGWGHGPRFAWVTQEEPYISPDLVYNTPPDPWAKRWTRRGGEVISVRY